MFDEHFLTHTHSHTEIPQITLKTKHKQIDITISMLTFTNLQNIYLAICAIAFVAIPIHYCLCYLTY